MEERRKFLISLLLVITLCLSAIVLLFPAPRLQIAHIWTEPNQKLRSINKQAEIKPYTNRILSSGANISATFFETSMLSCNISRTYYPSNLERKWSNVIGSINDNTREWNRGCSIVKEDVEKIYTLLKYYKQWKEDINKTWSLTWENTSDILSHFAIEEDCGKGKTVQYIPIEPLIGFMRHPLVHCIERGRSVVDKDYMFLLNSVQIFPLVKRNPIVTKSYIFDLGASLYNQGAGGASQQWFIEEYEKRGIHFDRILCWESTKMTPEKIYGAYPNEVVEKVSYYNLNAEFDLNSKMSPIRMIKDLVKVTDFLVLKIDIDNDPIELSIINSFINDPAVTNLIDEFFFEHHVSHNPVEHMGWGTAKKIMNITESYALFGSLRAAGVRAHSWV